MKQLYSLPKQSIRSTSLPRFTHKDKRYSQSIKTLTSYLSFYKKRSSTQLPTQSESQHIKKAGNLLETKLLRPSQKPDTHVLKFPQQESLPNMITLNNRLFPEDYDRQCLVMVQNLCLHFQIYKKVFKTSQRKKTAMSKLYGWDQQFSTVMFYGQQIQPNLNPLKLLKDLGLDKHTMKGKNTYNKLRLFLAELIAFNRKHQELQCEIQCKRFGQSLQKLKDQMEKLKTTQNGHKYQNKLKTAKNQMLNKKVKIKNKRHELYEIGEKTGAVGINDFFYHEEKNIDRVEKYLRATMY